MKKQNPIIQTSRRQFLRSVQAAGVLTAAASLDIRKPVFAAYDLTPHTTEGPYCLDLNLFRSDIRTSTTGNLSTVAGMPLFLTLKIASLNSDGTISPVSGAVIDLWHCNALGYYSGETNNGMSDETAQNWCRGYQISNDRGTVQFITIFPGWYTGRCVHMHIRTRLYNSSNSLTYDRATQLFFNDSLTQTLSQTSPYTNDTQNLIYNGSDNIFASASENLARVSQKPNYLSASMNVIIDPSDGVGNLSCPTSA